MYSECYSTFRHWIFTNQDLRHEVKAGLKFNACWTFLQCNATSLAFLPGIWNALIRELIITNSFLKGTENVSSHTHTPLSVDSWLWVLNPLSGSLFSVHCTQSPPHRSSWAALQSVKMLPGAFAQSCFATIFNSRRLKNTDESKEIQTSHFPNPTQLCSERCTVVGGWIQG